MCGQRLASCLLASSTFTVHLQLQVWSCSVMGVGWNGVQVHCMGNVDCKIPTDYPPKEDETQRRQEQG